MADGSALRLHTVEDGVLVRSEEAVSFQHAADGAGTLEEVAAAYRALAAVLEGMADAGGQLLHTDDGFLHISYDRAMA